MSESAIYQAIKQTVIAVLPGSRVLLFGSRANGSNDHLSDYDLLIITSKEFNTKEKISWTTFLDKAITNAINAPIDILLSSESEIVEKRKLPGHIIRTALREGIAL